MPKKRVKKTPEEYEAPNVVEEIVNAVLHCGHINRQYYNPDGALEDLACTLDKGHKGDHEADYPGGRAAWSDAAGTPTRQHA